MESDRWKKTQITNGQLKNRQLIGSTAELEINQKEWDG